MEYDFLPFWEFTSKRRIEKFRVVKQHHPRSEYLHFLCRNASELFEEKLKQYAWIEDIFNYLYFPRVDVENPEPGSENYFSKKAILFLLRHIPESVKIITNKSLTLSGIFTRILVSHIQEGYDYLKSLFRLESRMDKIEELEKEKKILEKNLRNSKRNKSKNTNTNSDNSDNTDKPEKENESENEKEKEKEIRETQEKLEEVKEEIKREKNEMETEIKNLVRETTKKFEKVASEYFKVVALGFSPDGFSDPLEISARKVEELLQIAKALAQQIRDIVINIKTNSLWEGSTLPDIKELDDEVIDIVEIMRLQGKIIFPESFVASPRLRPRYRLIVDTSGSMREKMRGWAIHKIEVAKILSQALVDNDIVEEVWQFNDTVQKISINELKMLSPGGGTNIDAVFRITQTPSIVITDGEWELSEKDNPNLWIFAFDPYQIEVEGDSPSLWRRVYEINIHKKLIAPVKIK